MKKCDQLHIELDKAKKSADEILTSKNLTEIDDHWKAYLNYIERIWNKAQSHFKKSPKWNNWQGKYVQIRRNDELLSYLINARGAEQHTVEEITQQQRGGFGIDPVIPGGEVVINNMIFGKRGDPVRISLGTDAIITTIPAMVKLLPITNRGVTYEVPKKHLGKDIDPRNLNEITIAGIKFYEDFIIAAENFFCKDD